MPLYPFMISTSIVYYLQFYRAAICSKVNHEYAILELPEAMAMLRMNASAAIDYKDKAY